MGIRLYLAFFLFVCNVCGGQAVTQSSTSVSAVNLTGAWTLDMKASDFGGDKKELVYDSMTLLIAQDGPVLKISRTIGQKKKARTQSLTYYTDGRGETNPATFGTGQIQSKTLWQANIVITKGTQSTQTFGDVLISDVTDKWELSDDGNTLIEYSSSSSPRSKFGNVNMPVGPLNMRRVFRKQP